MELVTTIPNIGGPAPIPLDLATVTLDVATLVGVYPASADAPGACGS